MLHPIFKESRMLILYPPYPNQYPYPFSLKSDNFEMVDDVTVTPSPLRRAKMMNQGQELANLIRVRAISRMMNFAILDVHVEFMLQG